MSRAVEADIGPEQNSLAHGDQTSIKDQEIEIQEGTLSDFEILPMIDGYRRINNGIRFGK